MVMAMKEYQCSKCRRLVGRDEIMSPEGTLKCPYCGESNPERILGDSFCSIDKASSSESTKFS
jgi:DNA-directed RNA polymerase subunit RPC12/RpoP